MSTEGAPRRQKRKNMFLGLSLAAVGVMAGSAGMLGQDGAGAAVFSIAGLAAIALSFVWFNALDEVAQRAHYEAWYWGGSLGLMSLPALALLSAALGDRREALVESALMAVWGDADLTAAVTSGVLVAMLPALLGYTLWWAAFWLRKG